MPRRTRCGICGDALWTYPSPTGMLKHVEEILHRETYDHDAVWPAPSEAEQRRIQEEKEAEHLVHRGQQPECPWCAEIREEADLQAVGLRKEPKDLFDDSKPEGP